MTKVAMENVDAVRRRLAVEIPAGEVTAEIERAYDRLRRKANVRGFRQGRAPRSVLERLFGDQVRADVFGQLVHDSFREALKEQKVEPVGQPEIITEQAELGQPLRYSATIEVKPAVLASAYDGIEVERSVRQITDADVELFVEELRDSFAQFRPVTDRTRAAAGDVATIDYEARGDGRPLARGQNRRVAVGGDQPTDIGFHLVGAEIGHPREFEVDYPDSHAAQDLAGRKVTFRVEVKGLATKEIPALDDDFAKDHGNCETLGELRRRVRERLEEAAAHDADAAVRSGLMDRLIANHDFEVPSAMVERRASALAEEVLESLGPRRPPASREAEVRQRMREELVPRARAEVKGALILEAIASQEHLSVSDDEIDEQIDRLADRAGSARERLRALYREPAARLSLRTRILQERALDLVLQRARVRTLEQTSDVAGALGNG
jgi:trigger factor